MSTYLVHVSIAKPGSFDKMVEAAKKLSAGFPEVRVDFYDISGNPIFGELTFSTGYSYFTDEYYDYLGSKVNIANVKKVPIERILAEMCSCMCEVGVLL